MARIKSVQRGLGAYGQGTTDVAISAVNLAKTLLFETSDQDEGSRTRIQLTSGTNIRVENWVAGGYIFQLAWNLVEFE